NGVVAIEHHAAAVLGDVAPGGIVAQTKLTAIDPVVLVVDVVLAVEPPGELLMGAGIGRRGGTVRSGQVEAVGGVALYGPQRGFDDGFGMVAGVQPPRAAP